MHRLLGRTRSVRSFPVARAGTRARSDLGEAGERAARAPRAPLAALAPRLGSPAAARGDRVADRRDERPQRRGARRGVKPARIVRRNPPMVDRNAPIRLAKRRWARHSVAPSISPAASPPTRCDFFKWRRKKGSSASRGAAGWVLFGALCLLIAWVGLLAAAVVALEGRLPLELRLLVDGGLAARTRRRADRIRAARRRTHRERGARRKSSSKRGSRARPKRSGAAIDELRERARAEFDLRARVRERPSAWLAGALVLGIWIGARR